MAISKRETILKYIFTVLSTPSLSKKINNFTGKFKRKILIKNKQKIISIF